MAIYSVIYPREYVHGVKPIIADTKTDTYPIINANEEEQWIGNQPPAYSVDNADTEVSLNKAKIILLV